MDLVKTVVYKVSLWTSLSLNFSRFIFIFSKCLLLITSLLEHVLGPLFDSHSPPNSIHIVITSIENHIVFQHAYPRHFGAMHILIAEWGKKTIMATYHFICEIDISVKRERNQLEVP